MEKDTPGVTVVNLNPAEYFYNWDIKSETDSDLYIDTFFAGYKVNDGSIISSINRRKSGEDITNLLYHTFKTGVVLNRGVLSSGMEEDYLKYDELSSYRERPLDEKDVDKIINNAIDKYQDILSNNGLTFDHIYFSESKSKHVEKIAEKLTSFINEKNNTTLKPIEIVKKTVYKLMREIFPPKTVKQIHKILSANNHRLTADDRQKQIFEHFYKLPDEDFDDICKKLIHNHTKFNSNLNEKQIKVYNCILITVFIIRLLEKMRELKQWFKNKKTSGATSKKPINPKLSAAGHIRSLADKFSYGGKTEKQKNSNIPNLKEMAEQLTGEKINSKYTVLLDRRLKSYFDTMVFNNIFTTNNSNTINVLCIDDNINKASTVYEITRLIKDLGKKKGKTIKVHWFVLFAPERDIDILKNNRQHWSGFNQYGKQNPKANHKPISPTQNDTDIQQIVNDCQAIIDSIKIKPTKNNIINQIINYNNVVTKYYELLKNNNITKNLLDYHKIKEIPKLTKDKLNSQTIHNGKIEELKSNIDNIINKIKDERFIQRTIDINLIKLNENITPINNYMSDYDKSDIDIILEALENTSSSNNYDVDKIAEWFLDNIENQDLTYDQMTDLAYEDFRDNHRAADWEERRWYKGEPYGNSWTETDLTYEGDFAYFYADWDKIKESIKKDISCEYEEISSEILDSICEKIKKPLFDIYKDLVDNAGNDLPTGDYNYGEDDYDYFHVDY